MKPEQKDKIKSLIPFIGERTVRKRLDEIFNRRMLGSVFIGSSGGKTVEKALQLFLDSTLSLFVGWATAFLLFIVLFIYWDLLAEAIEEEIEKQTD